MTDPQDLKFLTREQVLMELAGQKEKTRGRLEVLRLILKLFDDKEPPDVESKQRLSQAKKMIPEMEQDLLLTSSLMHWLTKERH